MIQVFSFLLISHCHALEKAFLPSAEEIAVPATIEGAYHLFHYLDSACLKPIEPVTIPYLVECKLAETFLG